jgi:hypothetical protein
MMGFWAYHQQFVIQDARVPAALKMIKDSTKTNANHRAARLRFLLFSLIVSEEDATAAITRWKARGMVLSSFNTTSGSVDTESASMIAVSARAIFRQHSAN